MAIFCSVLLGGALGDFPCSRCLSVPCVAGCCCSHGAALASALRAGLRSLVALLMEILGAGRSVRRATHAAQSGEPHRPFSQESHTRSRRYWCHLMHESQQRNRKEQRNVVPLKSSLTDSRDPHQVRRWELNSSPLEEHPVLTTTESSLQSQNKTI